jgi:phosphoribosylformylglycinamidine (FGAM) synthase-like amidotransferase family enzyme
MNEGWIPVTERLPNEEESKGKVIVTIDDDIFSATFNHEENFFVAIAPNGSGYRIEHTKQDGVDRYVTAWMPHPETYVKPNRWTVEFSAYDNTWIMRDNVEGWVRLLYIDRCHGDAAQRIADIYNEVIP